jgi:hypothetical protein
MISRKYHYLVSGLPEISFGDKMWTSIGSFRKYLEAHLHPDDFRQVKYVLLAKDHQNLVRFLKSGEIPSDGAGNYSLTDLRNPEDVISFADTGHEPLPEYMAHILLQNSDGNAQPDMKQVRRALDEGFYSFIMECGDEFLKRYYTFLYDMSNLLTFVKSGEYKLNQEEFITGDTPHARHLREQAGSKPAKDTDFEQFEEILSYTGNPSFAAEEMKHDQLRWRVIEEMNLFEYFSINRVLGYLLQMLILERWKPLTKAAGETKLRRIIDASVSQLNAEQKAAGSLHTMPSAGKP